MTKFFILLICQAAVVCASHFRGAIVSWSPTYDESQITVDFRISWRRTSSSNYCNDSIIDSKTLIGDSHLTCLTGCSGTVASLQYYCTDYSAVSGDDWSTGRNSVLYTPTAEKFSFQFSSCCWITLNGVGARGGWSILATADLRVRSDTGRINSSPTVEMTPIFRAQHGCHYNIILPVADVDGDIIKCRWATGTDECYTVCNGFTGAVLDESACSISYTANQNTGYYAVAIQVEDFASKISTTPLSSIPLQFLVKVYNGSSCANTPDFVAPTPKENACFAVDVGDDFNVTLKARSPQSLSGLTTISAVGMVRSTVVKTQDSSWHYIELNVRWTPTNDDAGRDHNLCFYATDVFGVSSSVRCITLPVSVTGPTPLRVERVGLTNTWVIVIDQTFSRPTDSAYIIVYEASTNKELLSVDVSNSSDVVFDPLNRQIKVTFDFDFDILEDYHVTIPSGLVEGYVSCGALSVAINDSTFWKIEVDCGELNILNGIVNAPNGTDYPHSITYVCSIGHDLIGNDTRTCTSNGTWTGVEPFCKPRDCGSFLIPSNGYTSTNSTIYATNVTFSCVVGYEISGNSSMTCDHTPAWTSSPPICVIIDCGTLTSPDNGVVSTDDDNTFNKLADYSCYLGYDLIGSSSRRCQSNKQWSGVAPSCEPKDCGQLLAPPDGTINISNTTLGSTVAYDCGLGFFIDGDNTRHCVHTGAWNGSDPTCKAVDCGSFLIPVNGYASTTSTIYGTNVTFSCVVGYEISGNSSMICDHIPAWTSYPPVCVIVDCGTLTHPENCIVSTADGTTFNKWAVYSCNLGFDLIGSSSRQCQSNKQWSGVAPSCKPKDCGSFSIPANGYESTASTKYATNVTFSCVVGYEISGNSSMICDHTPAWTSSPPHCVIVDCGTLTHPENGIVATADGTTFNKLAVHSCNLGYDLIGSSSRQCQSNKQWSGVAPSCEPKDCGSFSIPANGYASTASTIYATNVTFSCDVGYEISGHSSMICDHTPAWTSSPPICVIIDCGTLIHPENGIVSTDDGTTFNKLAVFSCDLGYDLIGSNSRQCQSNKQWSGVAPSCEPKDCGQLLSPPDGTIHISNTTFGNTVTYDCDLGFIIDGDNTRHCLHTGAWNGSDPTCKAVDCGPIPNIGNGTITYSGTTVGENATASCDIGFDLYGTSQRTCVLSGEWSGLPTRCEIKDCGSIFNLTNGKVTQESTVYGSVTNFTCDYGYELLGSNSSFCLENGSWGDDLPECILKECMRLSDPDGGQAVPLNASLGAVVAFTCNEGYTRSGPTTLNCTLGGTWSENPPICTKDSEGSSVAMYAAIGGGVVILILVILIAVAVCRRGVT